MTFQLYSKEDEARALQLIKNVESIMPSWQVEMIGNNSNYDLAKKGKYAELAQRDRRIEQIRKWCEEDDWIVWEIKNIF